MRTTGYAGEDGLRRGASHQTARRDSTMQSRRWIQLLLLGLTLAGLCFAPIGLRRAAGQSPPPQYVYFPSPVAGNVIDATGVTRAIKPEEDGRFLALGAAGSSTLAGDSITV